MNLKRKLYSLTALAAALGLTFALAAAQAQQRPGSTAAEAQAKIGEKAPAFNLTDHNGNDVSLRDFDGKIVVLEWFNDECPYVVKFYREGHMNKFVEEFKEKDVVWLAINSTHNHDAEHNKKIAEKWNMKHPILVDQKGTVGRMYGARTTPHMYIIDKDGTLVYAGGIDNNPSGNTADIEAAENYVKRALNELLNGETVSTQESRPYGCSVKYARGS